MTLDEGLGPWGQSHLTTSYRWFLARWAKHLSSDEVACMFRTTWKNVFESVKHAVYWVVAHQDLDQIEVIGVDEIQWQQGQSYLTLVNSDRGWDEAIVVGGPRANGRAVCDGSS